MDAVRIATPLGTALLKGDRQGVTAITLSEGRADTEVPDSLKTAAQQLREYFEGERETFDFPINPEGTPFQKRVWKALREIPFGKNDFLSGLIQKIGRSQSHSGGCRGQREESTLDRGPLPSRYRI